MAKTIPQLTDATTVNAADELIIHQGGITKRATGAELAKGLNAINGIVNVKNFGAAGDGVADDKNAIQAAIDFLQAQGGGTLFIPADTYYLSGAITVTNSDVKIVGAGRNSTKLLFGPLATTGVNYQLERTGTLATYQSASLRNLSLLTNNTDTDAGTGKCAVRYTPSPLNQLGSPYPTVRLDDVFIGGNNGFVNFWHTGVNIVDGVNALITNCVILGKFNNAFNSMNYAVYTGDQSVNIQVTDCFIYYGTNGIVMNAAFTGAQFGSEGLQVIGCQIMGFANGVIKANGTTIEGRPLVLVSNSHINATSNCVQVNNCTESIITSNLFYIQETVNDAVQAGASCVAYVNPTSGDETNRHIATGNVFRNLSSQSAVRGIVCDVSFVSIGSNVFDSFDKAIILQNDSNRVHVANCAFENIGTSHIDNASGGTENYYLPPSPMPSTNFNVGDFDNYLTNAGAATGSSPAVAASGADTNIDVALTPKGTGVVRFGSHAAVTAETVTGFITIKDSGGNARKLAVVS